MAPINLPDGTEVSEVILPDGASASAVIAPDGSTVFSAIPDSLINQYLVEDFTTSNWPDSEGTVDIDTISGLTFDPTAFGGEGGVVGGGSDYGASQSMDDWGNNVFPTEWAISFQFEGYTETGQNMFIGKDSTPGLTIGSHGFEGGSQDRLQFQFEGANGSTERNAVESDRSVNDGSTNTVILQKEGTNGADSMFIYFAADQPEQNILRNENDPSGGNLGEVGYLTWWDGSSPDRTTPMSIRNPRWFSDSLNQSERESVFSQY